MSEPRIACQEKLQAYRSSGSTIGVSAGMSRLEIYENTATRRFFRMHRSVVRHRHRSNPQNLRKVDEWVTWSPTRRTPPAPAFMSSPPKSNAKSSADPSAPPATTSPSSAPKTTTARSNPSIGIWTWPATAPSPPRLRHGHRRLVAWTCGFDHVRETIPFVRTLDRIYP